MKIDNEVACRLHNLGLTYQQIGDILGISRQRIHQIITGYESPKLKEIKVLARKARKDKGCKRFNRSNKSADEIKEENRNYRRNYARQHFMSVNGRILSVDKRPRPDDICEVCGKTVKRLDYHHWDDGNPKLGVWVCKCCHDMAECIDRGLDRVYVELKESIGWKK